MLSTWTIGDARVSSLVEYYGPTHDPAFLYPAFDRQTFEIMAGRLPAGHYYEASDRLVIAIQIWLIQVGGKAILVDTGVGNCKPRTAERMRDLNTLFLTWLAAAGESRQSITHVVHTHLHPDHIGWNTMVSDGRHVPTFPNARYLFPRRDFEFFQSLRAQQSPVEDNAFADSVDPVIDAGLGDFIADEREILGCLEVRRAPGHTPGMLNYWLRSGDAVGVFSGDVFHHPLQIACPGWNTAFCILPEEALATRRRLLEEAADSGALLMSCHFPPPFAGFVRRDGDGFRYEPAPADTPQPFTLPRNAQ